jgi:F-type H+-transporting ATPase subunit b
MSMASVFILPTTGTFIVEVVIFLTLLFLLAKYVLPPLNAAMTKRQEEIRHTMEAADRARAEAQAQDDERRKALDDARRQAREIIEQANRTAEQLATDAQTKRQAENEQARRAAEHEIELARQRAVDEASARLGDLVVEVVGRILEREVDANAHRDLIDEAVRALNAGNGAGAASAAGAAEGVGSTQ